MPTTSSRRPRRGPRSRHRALGACTALALMCTACARGGAADHPDAASPPTASAASSEPADAAPSPSAGPEGAVPARFDSWREAARYQHWARALELLDALPEEQRSQPAVRLALGRAALGAGQHDRAVKALGGLAKELPTVRREVIRWYAEAAAVAGPHDEGATLLAKSARVRDLIAAAQAYVRAGKPKAARKTIDKAVKRAQRLRRSADETRARMARASIAEPLGQKALAIVDWQWVIKERPGEPGARVALEGIQRLGGKISVEAELTALAKTTTKANLEATIRRLDELGKAHAPQQANVALARAQAYHKARTYAEALAAFDAAIKLVTPYRAEAIYFAGRSAERSGDPEGALERFQRVSVQFKKSGWAERGAYQRAQLLLQLGRFAEATSAFAHYLSRFGESKWAKEARLGYGLALLSAGKPKKAKETFVALRKDTASTRPFQAQLRQLEGLAALRAGDEKKAAAIWRELIREQPLTFPALAAHARLAQLGAKPLPPLIGPAGQSSHRALVVPLPPGPALLHSLGLDGAAERKLERMEQDLGRQYPNRESEALCGIYQQLSCAGRLQRIGNRAASLEVLMRPPSAADRWAWECVYPRPYAGRVRLLEAHYDVPAGLVHAIMRQESAFRVDAVSPASAVGLMQLMPNTAARAAAEAGVDYQSGDSFRPDVNLRLGTFYIGKLLQSFQGSAPLAVAAYNAGPHAVKRWTSGGANRETDLWVARIPYRETRNYVARVLANFARYQYLTGGVQAVTPLPLELPGEGDIGDDAY